MKGGLEKADGRLEQHLTLREVGYPAGALGPVEDSESPRLPGVNLPKR